MSCWVRRHKQRQYPVYTTPTLITVSSNGRTAGFGPVNLGSTPSTVSRTLINITPGVIMPRLRYEFNTPNGEFCISDDGNKCIQLRGVWNESPWPSDEPRTCDVFHGLGEISWMATRPKKHPRCAAL